jgi:ribosomal protein S18 acetylase RimI-like enzyme
MPGMMAERVATPAGPLPAIDIRRVVNGGTCDAFCAIGAVCFHVPLTWFREVFDSRTVWENFAAYVGYVDEEPVSTAAVVLGDQALGVYNVATLPGHQRHGYGEAVMRHALDEAHHTHGIERSVLQSTPAGFRLYQRMGYRTVTSVAVYAS